MNNDSESRYLININREETNTLCRMIIPEWIRRYIRRYKYRKQFPDSFVSCYSLTSLEADISSGCIIRPGCNISSTVKMGKCTTLGDNCLLRGGGKIEIGSFCSIAPEVVILSENHNFNYITTFPLELYKDGENRIYEEFIYADVLIEDDVWIGQRSIILAGAKIGKGCVIGAGSVVCNGEYQTFSLLAGNPARVVKQRLDQDTRNAIQSSNWSSKSITHIFNNIFDELHETSWTKSEKNS